MNSVKKDTEKQKVRTRRWWVWIFVVACAVIGTYFLFPRLGRTATTPRSSAPGKSSGKSSGKAGAARPVPVAATTARKGNINIYVIGLGNVTAYNTVTVKTRVDGELMQVAFREGQMVQKGDFLAQIDPRPYQVQLTQAEGTMARDEATLQNSKLDLERYQTLIQQSAVTKQQLDTQVAQVKQNEGTVKNDQGAIDNAKLQLVYCHITSPLSGRIGLRSVDQGNYVQAASSTGLAVVTQLQPIAVIFNMPEDNLPQVQKAMRGRGALQAQAWDRNLQTELATGKLLTLDNQIDQTTGTVRVKLEFANKQNTLFPNQFVNAKLLIDTRRGVVIIPSNGIQRSPEATYVYLIKADKTVDIRNITTGATEGDQVEIVKGLQPGDMVVTEGADKLQQGMKVSVRPAGRQKSDEDEMDSEQKGPNS